MLDEARQQRILMKVFQLVGEIADPAADEIEIAALPEGPGLPLDLDNAQSVRDFTSRMIREGEMLFAPGSRCT
jgi:hypothetical protein